MLEHCFDLDTLASDSQIGTVWVLQSDVDIRKLLNHNMLEIQVFIAVVEDLKRATALCVEWNHRHQHIRPIEQNAREVAAGTYRNFYVAVCQFHLWLINVEADLLAILASRVRVEGYSHGLRGKWADGTSGMLHTEWGDILVARPPLNSLRGGIR